MENQYTPPWLKNTGGVQPLKTAVLKEEREAEEKGLRLLNPKKSVKQLFAQEYVRDFNVAAASARTGITNNRGHQLMRDREVAQLIQGYVDTTEDHMIISRNAVLAGLLREANYFGEGATHASRVAAYSKLGKFLGMEVQTIQIKADIQHSLASLSDDELLARLRREGVEIVDATVVAG